jgi:plastocyanin
MKLKPVQNVFALLCSLLILQSCNNDDSFFSTRGGLLPTEYIYIQDGLFSQSFQNNTIALGTAITFVNTTSTNHTIISDDNFTIQTPIIFPSKSFYFKRDTTGTFGYHCVEHPSVRGTITYRP